MSDLIEIPAHLLPQDGRFGSGPSKVSDHQLAALMAAQPGVLGTSHRQAPVKNIVGEIRAMLAEFFQVPDGHEVILGNGGSTLFWDAAAFSLVDERAQHCAFGEFGNKFATATSRAPHLAPSSVLTAEAGSVVTPKAEDGIDTYAWPQNETSTGAIADISRPTGIGDALAVVDGTSAAGGTLVDLSQIDTYYFAPQKNFASDGGLYFAILSPAAVERVERVAASGRYIPDTLSLAIALENSRANQTLNTPAVATLVLMHAQLKWLLEQGGMAWAAARTAESSGRLYAWASDFPHTEAYITNPINRSPVVATLDLLSGVDAAEMRRHLRANGIVDIDPYRKLGRNQIRVGVFPAVDPDDVSALIDCLEFVVERLVT
ncbi:phosphoserine transaminase [Demequina sp.]|uniref:phosphoserine transaminase n=1 Tax=Demequina sp. TaxID=2050685 RepID=UPI003D110FD0